MRTRRLVAGPHAAVRGAERKGARKCAKEAAGNAVARRARGDRGVRASCSRRVAAPRGLDRPRASPRPRRRRMPALARRAPTTTTGGTRHVKQPKEIKTAEGKLGVLLPGWAPSPRRPSRAPCSRGAGPRRPSGRSREMGTIRLGRRTDDRAPRIKDFLPLAALDQLVFGAWDIFPDNAYESARHADVLDHRHLDAVREELERIRPMPAVFYPQYVRRLHGNHVKKGASKAAMVEQVREDIRDFLREERLRAPSPSGADRPRSISRPRRSTPPSRASRRASPRTTRRSRAPRSARGPA